MNRRGFFGTLVAASAAAALPLAKRAVEAGGYTILKLPRDMPVGTQFLIINIGKGNLVVMGGSVSTFKEGTSFVIGQGT